MINLPHDDRIAYKAAASVGKAARGILGAGLLAVCGIACAQQTHPCAAPAIKQARALLLFHHGSDVNVGVDDTVKLLAPLRNPVNARQFFDVLEVRGHVYRTTYQIRLIYVQNSRSCLLMGQEILERSSP